MSRKGCGFDSHLGHHAGVAELVYALVLGTSAARLEGSSPSSSTNMKKLIMYLGVWLVFSTSVLTFLIQDNLLQLTAVKMLWCLIIFWVFLCGSIIYFSRNLFWKYYLKITWPFWIKFTTFATLFFLIEEAIATAINYYFYPITKGMVMLTASTNYLEVIMKHSVFVFIPIFIIFSIFIKSFKLNPTKSFLYFGIVGTLAEISIGGLTSLLQFAMWIFVYGLIVYLPSRVD